MHGCRKVFKLIRATELGAGGGDNLPEHMDVALEHVINRTKGAGFCVTLGGVFMPGLYLEPSPGEDGR